MKRIHLTVPLLLALLSACTIGQTTRPAAFYVLSPDPGTPVAAAASASAPISIGLGHVELPDIFDRPQIVTRTSSNRIELAEYDRWGGDLNKDLGRVLAQNLMSRLNTDKVLVYPWPSSSELDYQVTVQFFRFDGQLGTEALLEGVWRVLDGDKGCELAADRFHIQESPEGSDYGALVSAISRAVARLSDAIASRIAATPHGC
jgi:uncharacterized lipoprotein YmbA